MQAVNKLDRLMRAASLSRQLELGQSAQYGLRRDPERCLIVDHKDGVRAAHMISFARLASRAEGAGLSGAGGSASPASRPPPGAG
jgi:hypothetical protein